MLSGSVRFWGVAGGGFLVTLLASSVVVVGAFPFRAHIPDARGYGGGGGGGLQPQRRRHWQPVVVPVAPFGRLAAVADNTGATSQSSPPWPSPIPNDDALEYLKQELTQYLEKRRELNADEIAKQQVGTVLGGTKGNKILEYVSGAPNKEFVRDDPPEPFDYDELTKYQYGHLATPIMKAGGRHAMYELLGLDAPTVAREPPPPQRRPAPLVIDRTGSSDPARYTGLKLGQVLDDQLQGQALYEVQQKLARGERPASSRVWEEVAAFERPFADRRNVGPPQTPDWTVEKLDEWGRKQGRVESWARKAKQGAFVKDPYESLDSLAVSQRLFSIVSAITTAVAFGRATPQFITLLLHANVNVDGGGETIVRVLQFPSVALLVSALASSLYCGWVAQPKNRSVGVWMIKGILGGPFAVQQLVTLAKLVTQQEQDNAKDSQ